MWHRLLKGSVKTEERTVSLLLNRVNRIFLSSLDTVSTVRGSGWVRSRDARFVNGFLILMVDPSATADGTDCVQVRIKVLHRQKRCQLVHDYLLADAAEGAIDVSHATVELGAIDAAVKIVCAFEESDCSDRNG